jgi:hypothetical protein
MKNSNKRLPDHFKKVIAKKIIHGAYIGLTGNKSELEKMRKTIEEQKHSK